MGNQSASLLKYILERPEESYFSYSAGYLHYWSLRLSQIWLRELFMAFALTAPNYNQMLRLLPFLFFMFLWRLHLDILTQNENRRLETSCFRNRTNCRYACSRNCFSCLSAKAKLVIFSVCLYFLRKCHPYVLLKQPRDYLTTFLFVGMIIAAVIGVVISILRFQHRSSPVLSLRMEVIYFRHCLSPLPAVQ